MNAVHAAASPLYRPQLGVGGQQLSNGSSPSSLNDHDESRGIRNQDQATSPLSPSGGSDFSFSKYQNDTYVQQRSDNNMGFASASNDTRKPNSGSTNSLMSQRSSGASTRDAVVIEHYVALRKYLTRHLAVEGIYSLLVTELKLANTNQRQNKAREKLIRLSKTQFNELSTDVYDELMRRENTQSIIKLALS